MRKHLAALHTAGQSDHVGSIGQHHTIKTKLSAQKSLDQLRRKGCRHDVLILDSRVKMSGVRRLHNVSCHDGFQTVVNEVLVYFSIACIPLLTAHVIDAVCHVLVAEVQSVARKMLRSTAESLIGVCAVHICLRHLAHAVHIVSIGAQSDDRVLPVVEDVADRGKGEITPDRRRLFVGHTAELVRVSGVSCRTDLGLLADHGSVSAGAVAAILRVARNDKRNLAVLLKNPVLLTHLGTGCRVVADTADVVLVHCHLQILFVSGGSHIEKKLTDLLLGRHTRDGLFHPFTVLIGQVKRFCLHIYHIKISLSFSLRIGMNTEILLECLIQFLLIFRIKASRKKFWKRFL